MANKKSMNGKYTGPASIAVNWEPYEISIVSVPADPTVGVGRELEDNSADSTPTTSGRSLSFYEWQLKINKNL